MMRKTAFSLPGMSDEARITVSPWPTETLWSPFAMRDSAAMGSPCEPVHMSTTSSSRSESTFLRSIRTPSGTLR
ncbi:hypothetical protein D3C74_315260 [compost metagenome]